MKAAVCTAYGPPEVLQIQEVAQPAPAANEVLIKVYATPVSFGELKARDFRVSARDFWLPRPLWLPARMAMGWSRPSKAVLGSELAGVVEAVGSAVTRFQPGDAVFAFPGSRFGANAEYICMPEQGMLALKPACLTYEEAACTPYGALTARYFVDKAGIQAGERVLINGASGGIGQYAVQLCKRAGAHVTGVCSGAKAALVAGLGADEVIDYAQTDFAQSGQRYDVILETARVTGLARVRGALSPKGRYVLAVFGMREVWQSLWTALRGGQRVVPGLASYAPEGMVALKEMIEAGELCVAIDRRYPLEEIAEAHRYVESERKAGQVVVVLDERAASR